MKSVTEQFTCRLFYLSLLILVCFPGIIHYQYNKLNLPPQTGLHGANSFNSNRAFQHLTELLDKIDSHPVDSQNNHLVANRIISKLKKMNYSVETQLTPSCVDSGNGTAHCATVKNLIVYVEGEKPERTILLSAHYDSVAAAPGASDAGTAVASLLTIAELLTEQPKAKNSVILLFNDGEEYGLLGARSFMSRHHLASKITDVINIDAIGSRGPSLLIETAKTTDRLLQTYSVASPTPVASSFISDIWSRIPSDTDMTIYKRHGLSGYNFINLENDPHYHTSQDNLENVSLSSLQQHGDNAWNLLITLLADTEKRTQVNQRIFYSDFLASKLIIFTLDEVYFLTGLCVLLWFISVWRLYKEKQLNITNSLVSHIIILSLAIVGGISGVVFKKICQILLDSPEPWNHYFEVMQLLLLFSISAVVLLSGHIWSFFNNQKEKMLALSSIYTGGLILTSFVYPQFSMLFILVALACNFILFASTVSAEIKLIPLTTLILSVIACLSFLPALYHLQTMMKFYLSPAIGILVALTLLPSLVLIPKVKSNTKLRLSFNPSLLIAVVVCSSLAAVCFTYLVLTPTYSHSMPRDLNLQLVAKENADSFILLPSYEDSAINGSDVAAKLALPSLISTANLPWSENTQVSSRVTNNLLLTEQVASLKSQIRVEANNDHSVIEITSAKTNLAGVKVYIPVSSKLRSIEYSGQRLHYSNDNRKHSEYYEFHCIGESCSDIKLDLNLLTDFNGDIWVSHIYHSLPKALSELVERRNQFASPKAKGDQTLLITKHSL